MLEFLGTYYEYFRGGIEATFELSVSLNLLEDRDVYNYRDYIDNSNFVHDTKNYMVDVTILHGDVDNIII